MTVVGLYQVVCIKAFTTIGWQWERNQIGNKLSQACHSIATLHLQFNLLVSKTLLQIKYKYKYKYKQTNKQTEAAKLNARRFAFAASIVCC